jgi:hypothetical protein
MAEEREVPADEQRLHYVTGSAPSGCHPGGADVRQFTHVDCNSGPGRCEAA